MAKTTYTEAQRKAAVEKVLRVGRALFEQRDDPRTEEEQAAGPFRFGPADAAALLDEIGRGDIIEAAKAATGRYPQDARGFPLVGLDGRVYSMDPAHDCHARNLSGKTLFTQSLHLTF